MSTEIPNDFVEHFSKKVETYGLDLPITPAELEKLCDGNQNCERALQSMLQYALRYNYDVWTMKKFVADKASYADEEWAAELTRIDQQRTQLHNTYIDSIKILSRALNNDGRSIEWVKKLAPDGTLNRAACGKFAIMLSYWTSVNGRHTENT